MRVRDHVKHTLIFATVFFGAGTAWAAGGEEPPGWEEFLLQLLNLAILLGAIVYFARKPVLEYFEGRRAQIKGRGVSGNMVLDGDLISVDLKLGLPASLVAGRVESGIRDALLKHFS